MKKTLEQLIEDRIKSLKDHNADLFKAAKYIDSISTFCEAGQMIKDNSAKIFELEMVMTVYKNQPEEN